MSLPLIAVSPYRLGQTRVRGWTSPSEAVPSPYLDSLRRAGGIPVVLGGLINPDSHRYDAGILLSAFAGVVLAGGGDVDPRRYGQKARSEVYGIDDERDGFELELATAAIETGTPLLAICRGMQVLNVALGGTLRQHIDERGLQAIHGAPDGTVRAGLHPVDVLAGSRLSALAAVAGSIERCVSIHHQCVERVAAPLLVTARSPDGMIESVETEAGSSWCVGVQWHPERSSATDPVQQCIFDGFVSVATEHWESESAQIVPGRPG